LTGDTHGRLKNDDLLTGEVGGGQEGAKSFDGEKAWSSLNIQNSFSVCALENICIRIPSRGILNPIQLKSICNMKRI
jgi:hypothetical protein